jgi:hypothetical protein
MMFQSARFRFLAIAADASKARIGGEGGPAQVRRVFIGRSGPDAMPADASKAHVSEPLPEATSPANDPGTRTTRKPSGSLRVTPCCSQYRFAASTGSTPTRSHASATASAFPR